MEFFMNIITNKNIYISAIVIVVGIVIYLISKKIINSIMDKRSHQMTRKRKTYARLFNNIFKYIILIIVLVTVLQINGVNVTSIITGLGLVSVIAGLALQDALKDIIMGFNIIVDDYFSVGDVVKINNIEGKVIEIGLKVTKLRDTLANNVYVIANRNISDALVISTLVDIDIPLPYEEDTKKMEKMIGNIINKIAIVENISDLEYKGIKEFGDSAIYYKIRFQCKPDLKFQAIRDANRIIKIELDKNKIEIPYKQIDIHNK